jgi:hypothetical protein
VKIQCQVSSGERTALAANSINCNPWNKKEKKKRKETSEFMISTQESKEMAQEILAQDIMTGWRL